MKNTMVAGEAADTTPGHTFRAAPNAAAALALAERAYAADADHIARQVLIGLLLHGMATEDEVVASVERGLSRFRERLRLARSLLGDGRSAPAR